MRKFITYCFVALLAFTSCDSELDINTNPNTPPEINKGLALSAAEGSIVAVMGGELFNLGGFYSQYFTQAPSASQFDDIDQYNIDTDFGNDIWEELYSGALNDLVFVQDLTTEDGDTGTYFIATVLKAYTFQYLVDIFGDVPYTEALQGNDNISPAPTKGEEIYLDLIASIDEAMEAYQANPVESEVGRQDLIYNADMERWIEFANTLKLRLYLRMSHTSQASSSAVMELINENNFLTESAVFNVFTDESGKRHPYYEVQVEILGDINAVASNSLHEFFAENNDPRLKAVYKPNAEGKYIGLDQGMGLSVEFGGYLASEFSRPRITPTTPVYLMTTAESNFLQAEALVRYAGGAGAEERYIAGVKDSFQIYGLSTAEAAAFTSAGGAYEFVGNAAPEAAIEQIIIQKWASLANVNNIEAWIETLRTGYPLLTDAENPLYEEGRRIISEASVLPGNQIPLSLFYPDEEVQRNRNLSQKATLLEKVWWNQK